MGNELKRAMKLKLERFETALERSRRRIVFVNNFQTTTLLNSNIKPTIIMRIKIKHLIISLPLSLSLFLLRSKEVLFQFSICCRLKSNKEISIKLREREE